MPDPLWITVPHQPISQDFIYFFFFLDLFCYYFWICIDNRRFQATNPNAATAAPSGDQGSQLSSQQNPVQNSQHQNGVLLKASQKDLECKYPSFSCKNTQKTK